MSRPTLGPKGRAALRVELGERDRALLASVDCFRLLTARQIEALHFAGHATPLSAARSCRRVLERLHGHRVLSRLERRVGGIRAGSASYVYGVGPVGDRLLREGQPRRRLQEPTERFVRHTLAVAQLAIDLQLNSPSGSEVLAIATEPSCWRAFIGAHGSTESLKPDLRLTTATADYEHHWFVEVDLATESGPAVVRKCRVYQAYWQTGREQADNGLFPRVAWVVPDERRQHQLEAAIAAANLDEQLFVVMTRDKATTVLSTGAPP